jgi:hypothetical protein
MSLKLLEMVLAYDQAGSDRGNVLKTTKELASFEADKRAVLGYLKLRSDCTGQLGVMGICIDGHLAFRAAMCHVVAYLNQIQWSAKHSVVTLSRKPACGKCQIRVPSRWLAPLPPIRLPSV